ncbi:hypothetical protein [Synechococcus sp. PCC 7336]|uniref:hypothetical protein n=1 Tax=Synechococcus sp. PCC 7336 TaxID=195250 RepID=UPI0003771BB3|nr:hypothetical protein [Synechococcus sp. PCC 7336]
MSWKCRGITTNGNTDRKHDEYEVHGKFCPECGLLQDEVEPLLTEKRPIRFSPIAVAVGAIALLVSSVGYLAWQNLRPCAEGQPKVNGQCSDTAASPPTLSNPRSPTSSNTISIHRNTNYGISVEYPNSWELRRPIENFPPNVLTGTKDLFQLLAPDRNEFSYRANILVKIEQIVPPVYFDEYAETQIARIKQLGTFSLESDERIQLGDRPAREIVYSGNDGEYSLRRRRIIIEPITPRDYFILITYTSELDDYENNLPDAEKVFASITLLE